MATPTNEMSATESITAYGPARSTVKGTPLSPEEVGNIDAYLAALLAGQQSVQISREVTK